MSTSLINLTHYLHHLIEHTLYEHEHLHSPVDSVTSAHGHSHNDILDRFLHKIETGEDPEHEHDLLNIVLMEHINTGNYPLPENMSFNTGYFINTGRLDTIFFAKPLSPPPKPLRITTTG